MMTHTSWIWIGAIGMLGMAQAVLGADASGGSTNLVPKEFHSTRTQDISARYLLSLPKGYGEEVGKKWPLILFLHGAGERGSDIWKVAKHGPPKRISEGEDLPFIVVSPQCPEGQIWSNDVLLPLLEDVMRTYAVDAGRVYLTGLSMGGYGTWSLGTGYPEKFAAIVPICGGGQTISVLLNSRDKGTAMRTLGIWAFHGAKDPVVTLNESQRMVDACKRAGVAEVKLTVYPEAEHDSWTETYKNPELYEWLLKHERKSK